MPAKKYAIPVIIALWLVLVNALYYAQFQELLLSVWQSLVGKIH
jgi:hypothetical protein